ncbi:hypothetical protein ACJMK2_032456 [Sinanodonta woodiana]|uniref:Uncharacterized protein n=1 Tax=Sinanodonta woodiana TaxID=1069815 RepID=A0ABD3X1S3_SINWO
MYTGAVVKWKKWALVKENKSDCTGMNKTVFLSELEEELHTFSCHLTNVDWQHKAFANLKENLPENWLLLWTHWARQQVTIHPVIAYYRSLQHHDTITESLIFISDDLQHDIHAVQHYQMIAVNELQCRGLKFTKKGKTSFVDASYGEEDIGISMEKHFLGSRHGKGPCDAEIGVIKIAEEMFNFCTRRLTWPESAENHSHNRRKFFFVPQRTINRHRPDRTGPEIKTVVGIGTLHCRSCFCQACTSEEGLCANAAFCGDWRVAHLKKKTARPQQNVSTTASANEEYPNTNASPVPASITAASFSEAVTDVFQANSIRAGHYHICFPVQQGRKTIRKEYGAIVLQVQKDDIEVRYLCQKDGKCYFPDTEDDAWVMHADIVGHLDIAQMASRVFH